MTKLPKKSRNYLIILGIIILFICSAIVIPFIIWTIPETLRLIAAMIVIWIIMLYLVTVFDVLNEHYIAHNDEE